MIINDQYKFIFIHTPKTGGSSVQTSLADLRKASIKKYHRSKLYKRYCDGPSYPHHPTADQLYAYFEHFAKKRKPENLWRETITDMHKYFMFAFTRHPFDLAVSQYFYERREPKHEEHDLVKDMSWDSWVDYKSDVGFISQKAYIYLTRPSIILPHFVGKYENIQADFNYILDTIGRRRMELPRVNATKSRPSTADIMTDHSRALIREKCAEDFRCFGYE